MIRGFDCLPVKDPVLHTVERVGSLFLRLIPRGLYLAEEIVLVSLCALLDLLTLVGEVFLQTSGIPVGVRAGYRRLPVCLDEVLQFLAVSGLWEGDVVVREPSLKLGLVPFVVG